MLRLVEEREIDVHEIDELGVELSVLTRLLMEPRCDSSALATWTRAGNHDLQQQCHQWIASVSFIALVISSGRHITLVTQERDVANLRVGIISANWGIAAHLPAWRAVPGVEVVGICTAHQDTAEAAARANGIPRAFWDYREMAASPDIDVVDVGTRPNLRFDMCMAALANGKHVYDGVPFVDSMEHALTLHEAYTRANRVGIIDAYSEYLPPIAFAKELLDDGAVGDLFSVTCTIQMSLFNYQVSTFGYNWFWNRTAGCSALRNLGSHAMNVLYYLFGEVDEVIAQDELLLKEWKFVDNGEAIKPQVEDTSNALLRFRKGGIGVLATAWCAIAGRGFTLDAFGSKGRLLLEGGGMPAAGTKVYRARLGEYSLTEVPVPGRFWRRDGVGLVADPASPDVFGGTRFAMALSYANMVEAIERGEKGRPNFSQALHSHAVIEAAHLSAVERRWVGVQEMLGAPAEAGSLRGWVG
jgi:predicted dehydrogenase